MREAWRQAARQQAPAEASGEDLEEEDLLEPAAATAGPLELALEHEHTRQLRKRLRVLNARERRILGLQALGLSYQEIGRHKLHAHANDT